MATKSALERIADLKDAKQKEIDAIAKAKDKEIQDLKEAALSELKDRRKDALAVLKGIDDEIADLTEKPSRGSRGGQSKGLPDVPSAAALKSLLNKAEDKKLNRKGINSAGYSLKSALAIAKEDNKTFGHKQNKAQGEVWLK